jgi:hypothetical protein
MTKCKLANAGGWDLRDPYFVCAMLTRRTRYKGNFLFFLLTYG